MPQPTTRRKEKGYAGHPGVPPYAEMGAYHAFLHQLRRRIRPIPGWRICTSCREGSASSTLARVREHESQEAELSRRRDERRRNDRRRVSSTTKSCIVCDKAPRTLLGVTISSRPSCRSCGVRYWLEEHRARWWMPTLTGSEPGCLLSPALLSAAAIPVLLVRLVLL